MKILITLVSLDLTGVPSYTRTLYRELEKRGHEVVVYCPQGVGPMTQFMNTCSSFDGVETPDVILGQGALPTTYAHGHFSNVPLIFINHGVLPDEEQPPRIHIDRYIAINEQSVGLLTRQHIDPEKIDIVRDFIDVDEFKPINELHEQPSVLFLSNYKKWKTFDVITEACRRLNLELVAKGSPYGRSLDVPEDINKHDIVISWGRGILESMACGRAAISYNKLLGDGFMTPETYMDSRTRNFGGYECRHAFTVEGLMDEIKKYTVESGSINRKLALEYHDSVKGTDAILEVVNKIL